MPVHNEDIAAIFNELADLLEVEDANPFRVRAYRTAARTVRGLGRTSDISDLEQVVVLARAGTPVLLKDVATVTVGPMPNLQTP